MSTARGIREAILAVFLGIILAAGDSFCAADDQHKGITQDRRRIVPPTAVTLVSYTAELRGDSVVLRWVTGYEVDNLGFRLYRDVSGALERLNPELIAGSALLVGAGTKLSSGRSYEWRVPAEDAAAYWLEEIDLKGRSTWHGPAFPSSSVEPSDGKARAAIPLSRLAASAADSTPGRVLLEGPAWTPTPRQTAPSEAARQRQFELAEGSTIKIGVTHEGWYRLTRTQLVSAGLDPSLDPRLIAMYADGTEQAVRVNGESDGRFDPGDWIEFYGLGTDTPWTGTRVYWLTAGKVPGRRIAASGSTSAAVPVSSFPFTCERRDRVVYFAALASGERDNFFGPVVGAGGATVSVDVQHADPVSADPALLEVSLQGETSGPHRVGVRLNDSDVGTLTFDGAAVGRLEVTLDRARLRNGPNEVRLTATGGELDVSLVDSVRLTYPRLYVAAGDSLIASLGAGQQAEIRGFSTPAVNVFDVTDPDSPREIPGNVAGSPGAFTVRTANGASTPIRILAVAAQASADPAWVSGNQPSSWNRSSSGVEVFIVAHPAFLAAAGRLRLQHEAQGLGSAVVDVEDLYDEFSFGAKTPEAIRRFIGHVQTCCGTGPRHLVLFGDASLDPRNYLGTGVVDFVPTKLIDTGYLKTASDDWLADLEGSGVPTVSVGRLPVRTGREAEAMVDKLSAYRGSRRTAGWTRNVLLVSDTGDTFDFSGANARIRSGLGAGFNVEEVRREALDDRQANRRILDLLAIGTSVVQYFGHGSIESWRGDLLTSTDASHMANGLMLPLFVAMNCLNGFFTDVYSTSLGEALVKTPIGGALAVWASSGLTDPAEQLAMAERVYALLQQPGTTIGEAVRLAKTAATDLDVRRTWILLGDPTLRSPLPSSPPRANPWQNARH